MLLLIIHFFWGHKAATCVTKMTKVDIEGSELGALPEWIESGALEKVDPKTWTKRKTYYVWAWKASYLTTKFAKTRILTSLASLLNY